MPKKKDDPKSRARKARVKKEKKKEKEDKKDSEDPGSGVDWGDESAKEEEPSSEYELVTEEEESVSSAPDAGPAASSGAVDPFRHLSGTRRSLKVREEIIVDFGALRMALQRVRRLELSSSRQML